MADLYDADGKLIVKSSGLVFPDWVLREMRERSMDCLRRAVAFEKETRVEEIRRSVAEWFKL